MGRARSNAGPLAVAGDLIVERDRSRPSGRLLRQGAMDASYIDLADPTHLEFDYLRWLRIVLHAARARRVLHLGGGACALARALATEDPSGRQDVCEIDPDVLALARDHLGLRRMPGLRVREIDGRAFLDRCGDHAYDAIAVDAFVGARVATALSTSEAAAAMARVAPLAVVNVVDDRRGAEVSAVAAALSGAYPRVWALGARVGNTLVAGDRARSGWRRSPLAPRPTPPRRGSPRQPRWQPGPLRRPPGGTKSR